MTMAVQEKISLLQRNANDLVADLHWLNQVIDTRVRLYLRQPCPHGSIEEIPLPDLRHSESPYADFLNRHQLGRDERLILLLALAPHVCPWVLDVFLLKNENNQRGFTEFGGLRGVYHSGFLPTGETAAFLVAAENLSKRFWVQKLLEQDSFFYKMNILKLEKEKSEEPYLSGALILSKAFLSYFTTGEAYRPTFSNEFPAQRITTNLDWEDLVLEDEILEDLQEMDSWLRYNDYILEDMGLKKSIKPGFRALFYGPPGTGKTLAVSLLGKHCNLEVYRVDISKVVSKYIGETEKNLANIFDQAENKNWILFFDEADAIFGKRTATKDSRDRHANQEVAYLLQRIEDFPGLVILASNLKANIDEAFARRFQSMVYFPMPRPELRYRLWQKAFKDFTLGPDIDLWKIAQEFELTGGAIINVLRYCAIKAAERQQRNIMFPDLLTGIRKEFRKEGKTV